MQKGFITTFAAILIMVFMLSLALSISSVIFLRRGISENIVKSSQAYYLAEGGMEDALLRLKESPLMDGLTYPISVGENTVSVNILDDLAGSRTIVATGNYEDRIKKIQVVYGVDTQDISFHYGVQAGDLGVTMVGNAKIYGNVFSNGTITGASNTKIYGDAISAGPNGKIKDSDVSFYQGAGGNAWAKICEGSGSNIDGNFTYVQGGTQGNCDVDGLVDVQAEPIPAQEMPITASQIQEWKDEAEDGGSSGSYSLGGNDEDSLGPVKVSGNVTLDSNAVLTINGTIWITGNLVMNSNSAIELASEYGTSSGVIIVDGAIIMDSNVAICGSEGFKSNKECYPQAESNLGSYLMLLSTKSSSDPGNPAISASSNTRTAVLYAANGYIKLNSHANLKEATGYGIYMESNAEVWYQTGLANPLFSSGPGGSWKVLSWEEIE